jgi:hypothetical protein
VETPPAERRLQKRAEVFFLRTLAAEVDPIGIIFATGNSKRKSRVADR